MSIGLRECEILAGFDRLYFVAALNRSMPQSNRKTKLSKKASSLVCLKKDKFRGASNSVPEAD